MPCSALGGDGVEKVEGEGRERAFAPPLSLSFTHTLLSPPRERDTATRRRRTPHSHTHHTLMPPLAVPKPAGLGRGIADVAGLTERVRAVAVAPPRAAAVAVQGAFLVRGGAPPPSRMACLGRSSGDWKGCGVRGRPGGGTNWGERAPVSPRLRGG